MKTSKIALLLVSGVCGATYLVTISLQPYPGSVLIKALSILPLALLGFSVLQSREGNILGAALLFSCLGDVLLDLNPAGLFVFGLGAFLIAHVLYIVLFVRVTRRPLPSGNGEKTIVVVLVAYSASMLYWLWPNLGALAAPVVTYICIITAMGISANLAGFAAPWIAVGALLFILSDSVIAVSRFKMPVNYSGYVIWLTYYGAQCLITIGFLREATTVERPGASQKA